MWASYMPVFEFVILLILASLAARIDLRAMILPDSINAALALAGLGFQILRQATPPTDSLFGILLGGAIPALVRGAFFKLRNVEGLGLGDVKFSAAAGAWTGTYDFPVFLFISSIAALTYAAPRSLLASPVRSSERIIFGPFLGVGLLITMMFRYGLGQPIIDAIAAYQ